MSDDDWDLVDLPEDSEDTAPVPGMLSPERADFLRELAVERWYTSVESLTPFSAFLPLTTHDVRTLVEAHSLYRSDPPALLDFIELNFEQLKIRITDRLVTSHIILYACCDDQCFSG